MKTAKSTVAAKKTTTKATAPKVDKKMAAANDAQPETLTAAANVTPENAGVALNQEAALKPEVVEKLKDKAAPKAKAELKPKEEFLVKLRSKGDLLKALRAGGILFLANGLWRLDPGREDQKVHRVSKRRAVAFRAAEIIVPTTQAGIRPNAYVLNQAKAAEGDAPKKGAKATPAVTESKAVAKAVTK